MNTFLLWIVTGGGELGSVVVAADSIDKAISLARSVFIQTRGSKEPHIKGAERITQLPEGGTVYFE